MAPRFARWCAAWAVAWALGIGSGCGGQASRPNLVLVVLDNVRADHVGAYGYSRPTTPTLDELAREGTRFSRALAPSSWTRPSVASLFTSRLPSEHGAVAMESSLTDSLPTLAETLRKAGYRTAGFSGNFVHVSERGGLARGFEHWTSLSLPAREGVDELWRMPGGNGASVALRAPRGDELTRAVLDALPKGSTPLFLYVHYMDAHVPWVPDAERWRRFSRAADAAGPAAASSDYVVRLAAERPEVEERERLRLVDLYDAQIAGADAALGELLRGLRERGVCPACVVLVASDHGEELGEHGGWFHGGNLYGESLAVPLVLHDGRRPFAGVDGRPASLIDVAPTLLGLAGVAVPPEMRGVSLLAPSPSQARLLAAELHEDPSFERAVRAREQRLALVRWPWKLIVSRQRPVVAYQLERDPGELVPLGAADGPAAELGAAADALLAAPGHAGGRDAELTPEEREALRALGYAR
jgi:arylsulfatase A-like enzyme